MVATTRRADTRRHEVDVAVVGAGPVGLYAGYYAGMRGLTSALIDALPYPGGQVTALYPDKYLYDIAGHPRISGRDLIDNLLKQLRPFPPRLMLGVTATQLHRVDPGPRWLVRTEAGDQLLANAVVVTAGAGTFRPRPLPCASPWFERGVHHHTVRSESVRGLDVVVAGGGDSAVDCALAAVETAASVTLVHRGSRMRAHEHSLSALSECGVRKILPAQVVACRGEGWLTEVTVQPAGDAEPVVIPAQCLVVALGFITRPGPLQTWGLELEGGKVVVGRGMGTNLTLVYAAGDISTYPGKVPLIATGFGEAATAINNAAALLRPGEEVAPGHSSEATPSHQLSA